MITPKNLVAFSLSECALLTAIYMIYECMGELKVIFSVHQERKAKVIKIIVVSSDA